MAKKELKEDTEDSIGESLVTPVKTPAPSKKKGLSKKDEAILVQVLGVDTANRVMEESLVSVTKLDKTNRFEVTVDRQEQPRTLFYFDDEDIIMEGPIEKTSTISRILPNSVSATGKYSISDMAKGVNRYLDNFLSVDTGRERRSTQVKLAEKIRNLTKNLSDVFGFDDPRQLETFIAAWLMKDSTCRLSGIPGTGKTTAIESSAILMANSYGYDTQPRYVRRPNGDIDLYEHGQNFEVYLNNLPDLRRAWDDWRFTPWSAGSKISGSYSFDFAFLQKNGPNGAKKPLRPSDFKRALFNADIIHKYNAEGKLEGIVAKPLTVNAKSKTKETLKKTEGPLHSVDYSKIISGSEKFETDAGSNQGYKFREYLMNNFYDARLDSKSGRKAIQSEMLEEVGVAKIDYDKRADEVLYGMEIQQITTDLPSGDKMAAYAFEPIPRKVVTQPIKFFNEANRSQSGVEDAILGLIAERTVEYRGKTFDSPHFIAWMDTNPHQKGNDLAFVDRIDTELFFTTITLGERYNQLRGRHKGGSGLNPQQQLVTRITNDEHDDNHLTPQRFNELDIVWDFIHGSDDIAPLPFSPPGAEGVYDGLRDIAMLSVMFTQRYFVRPAETHVLGDVITPHTLYTSRDIHTSPLMDISKASNPLLLRDTQEDFAVRYGNKDSSDPFQAPALFRRVLGFRFTNSLVKLSRAFAFLRGKDYVTREEILDALPYVVGHRLGPARAGEDSDGGTNGLVNDNAFGTLLNEQEMIREFIVHGYLLADTDSFLGTSIPRVAGTNQTMMDSWDAFYSRCQEALRSSANFLFYEENVLYPVKIEILGVEGSIIIGYTPVHWHLATMVVENERNCPPGYMPLKDYSNSRCGPAKNYPEMYNKYLGLMDRPAKMEMSTSAALVADYAIHDYYTLRGLIAREPHLFTDDRSRLLDLVESRINTIAKGPYSNILNPPPLASKFAVATEAQFPGTNNFRIEPSPTNFSLRTYGDALGAYGYVISQGTAGIEAQSLVFKQGAQYTLKVQNWADQSMVLIGDYIYDSTDASKNPTQSELQKSRLFQQMTSLEEVFGGNTGGGLIFSKGDEKAYKTSANLGLFLASCKQQLINAMNGPPGNDAYLSALGQGTMMACYELNHAPNSRRGAGLERLGVKDMKNDTLRLWLRFRPLGTFGGEGGPVTFLLTIGITSNFIIGTEYEEVRGIIEVKEGRLMDIMDRSGVNNKNFAPQAGAKSEYGWDKLGMADAGNMTLEDMAYYQLLYRQVISDE
jgi:MoxR-like ATPase